MRFPACLALLLIPLFGRASADDPVQAQVKGFYHWYVHELNKSGNGSPLDLPAIHRFVSAHFLKDIAKKSKHSDMDGGGLDYDPVLMAQDWDKDWENNIRIKDMEEAGAKWNVQVELSGKQMEAHRLNLVLVKEGGAWKIDKISDGDTPR